MFTAVAVIGALRAFGLLSLAGTVDFRGGGHSIANVQKLQQVWDSLNSDFYMPVDDGKMIESAAAAMANSLGDVYTSYYTKDEMRQFTARSAGVFHGIGVYVAPGENGRLRVTRIFEDSPALEAGVLVGDQIVSVDGTDAAGLPDTDSVIALIKGEAGTRVSIRFYRPSEGRELELSIERREIKADNIFSKLLYVRAGGVIVGEQDVVGAGGGAQGGAEPGIQQGAPVGYIKLVMFDNSASKYFDRHLDALLEKGISALVIDLRGNTGGNFDEVIKIAGRIVGDKVVVYTEDRAGRKEYSDPGAKAIGLPVRLLINGDSASASEILAGAVKDYGAGRLIGTTTFGKGLVQAVLELKDGSGLKYTRSRYFTPSGASIQGTGIEPDVYAGPEQPGNAGGGGAGEGAGAGDGPLQNDGQLFSALVDLEKYG